MNYSSNLRIPPTSVDSSLRSSSISCFNKSCQGASSKQPGDKVNEGVQRPGQRKDLFRAYLDIRQHSTPFESSKANYLSKIGDTVIKPNQAFEQTSQEFFSGGQKGIHSSEDTFKMLPRPSREASKHTSTSSSAWFSCSTPTMEEVDLKKKSVLSSYANESEAANGISSFQFPHLLEDEKALDDNKENLSENIPEKVCHKVSNTFENVFGGRYDCVDNETQNNHIDYQRLQSMQLNAEEDDTDNGKRLYRMATGPTRCAAWKKENEMSRRVLHLYDNKKDASEDERDVVEDSTDDNFCRLGSCVRNSSSSSYRVDNTRVARPKSVRNAVLSSLGEAKHTHSRMSQRNRDKDPEEEYSSDPFNTRCWFKNNDERVRPSTRSGRQGMVVPEFDPLSVTMVEEPSNAACMEQLESAEDSWVPLNSLVKERLDGIKAPIVQNKGLPRSECNWYREKHVYNKERMSNFKPECRYNFSCVLENPNHRN